MKKNSYRQRMLTILDYTPELKAILMASDDLVEKRNKIRYFLADYLFSTFEDDPKYPSLEWILMRDAINVFKNILTARSERLAGYSMIEFVNNIIHEKEGIEPKPNQAFIDEFETLIRGISGKARIYSEKIPAFLKQHGKKASQLRSSELSRMSRMTQKFMDRYPCGLDKNIVQQRSANKSRILKYFNATEWEWEDWKWHTRHIIRDADTLRKLLWISNEDYESVKMARQERIPFGITPYYLSLMDDSPDRTNDRGVRAQVIPPMHYVKTMRELKSCNECSMDFMLERDTTPIEGVTRRYPRICIIKPILTCPQICVYCQRNWEIEDVYSRHAIMTKDKLEKAMQWIEKTSEINEVLITGGDPLLLSNERIENLMSRLSRMSHIQRIRIGTRTPVTLPQRITDSLARTVNRYHHPGKREVMIITHFEHSYEITPQAMDAVQKFRRYGIDVYNQLVYTFYNSRKFEATNLRHNLKLIGVTPYYTFNTKGKSETDDYRVPIARLLQEQKEEARLMPGTERTDEIVFNVPKLGKNYLRASQHHDVISILPDGRRVYEFHPWEKKLTLVDTYIYTDVSIYNYLRRLQTIGESIEDYKTIWYYY